MNQGNKRKRLLGPKKIRKRPASASMEGLTVLEAAGGFSSNDISSGRSGRQCTNIGIVGKLGQSPAHSAASSDRRGSSPAPPVSHGRAEGVGRGETLVGRGGQPNSARSVSMLES